MEPMSTLIFAAARFSDLPELCDLRHIFTERYGSHMESSIKAEFVEKLQTKSFSQEKKLQLMKDIAQEFSVTWDSSAFEHKLFNLSAPKYDQPKNCMRRHGASQKPSTRLPDGVEEISSEGKNEHAPVSVWKREVRKEPKDIHVVTTIKDGFSHDLMERTRKAITDEPENMEPDFSNAALPSYAKPRRSRNGTYNHDQLKDGLAHKWTGKAREALDTIGSDRGAVGMKKSSSGKAVNMAPPYTKSHGEKNGNGLIYEQLQKVEEDHTNIERQPVRAVNNDRLINMRPPYVRLKANDPSSHPDQVIQDSKISDRDRYDGGEDLTGGVFVDEKSRRKPVSVRRKVAKPTVMDTTDSTIDEEKIMIGTRAGRGSDTGRRGTAAYEVTGDVRPPVDDEMDNAIDYGKLLHRTPSGQRRHGSRRSGVVNDGCDDEEEMMMDKLLIHYSRKGTASEGSKIRITSKALLIQGEHEMKEKIRPGSRGSVHVPDRSSSLPPELTKPEAGVKMHSRAASLQPDMLSPNGGRVHPRLPNYDDLAAQFNALRRS
ncbi:hypothetical protein COCNU_contig69521995G000010 [Cocos nucifera]|nr:hypothetical protein [Cocos nucifera]